MRVLLYHRLVLAGSVLHPGGRIPGQYVWEINLALGGCNLLLSR